MAYQQIQLRRDTAARWAAVNPVLAQGEPGLETDTGRQKVGNGTAKWTALPYSTEQGPVGPVGPQGKAGPQGERGGIGERGPQGPVGASGPATTLTMGTVATGPIASATLTGVAPAQTLSLVLPKGDRGEVGPVGPQGIQGPQGDAAGVVIKGKVTQWPPASDPDIGDIYIVPTPIPVFVPAGFSSGDAALWDGDSWENAGPIQGPRGEKGEKGDIGAAGTPGGIGPAGQPGPANNLFVGSVTAGQPGTQPIVAITGNSPSQTISFVLPSAPPNSLSIGSVTQGFSASAWIDGTPPNQILNLVLPNPAIYNSTSFSLNPQTQTVASGREVTFTAYAQSTEFPIVYLWQSSTDGNTWLDIDGSGTETLTFTAGASLNGRLYRCSAATPSVGRVYSQIATLTVKTPAAGEIDWSFSTLPETDYLPRNVLDDTSLQTLEDGTLSLAPTPQFGRANGKLYLHHHNSTDAVNWSKSIGIQSGYVNWNVVRYFSGLYVAWTSQGGSIPSGSEGLRWISSDGQNWESVGPAWRTLGIGRDTGSGLEVTYYIGVSSEARRGLTTDGRDILDQGFQPLSASVPYFEEEIDGIRAQSYASTSPAIFQSKIGSSAWISDIFLCFARGMVNGQMCWVASTKEDFHYTANGSATTRLVRPAGINFRSMVYGLGTWVAVHHTDPTIYYTAPDLVGPWKTNSLSEFTATVYWDRLGRPEFLNGRFVIPLSVSTLRQLAGFLASN